MSAKSYTASEATEKLAQEWRDRGFQVFVEPRNFEGLEGIFRYYKPDIIAIKNDEKLIIEVKSKGAVGRPLIEAQLKQVREILKDYPEWKFQVVYYGEEYGDLPVLSQKKLLMHINQVDNIITIDPNLALIKLWSLTEALVRHLYPEFTRRPQSPGRLVELLAGQGDILPDQAAYLRDMSYKRNKFVHGDLTVLVQPEEVIQMQSILSEVLADLPADTD